MKYTFSSDYADVTVERRDGSTAKLSQVYQRDWKYNIPGWYHYASWWLSWRINRARAKAMRKHLTSLAWARLPVAKTVDSRSAHDKDKLR